MPNTITSFTQFTAATKARSSEVNTNFSNFRGTIVPINENTASASDNSHDLGSDEHRWRTGYFGTSINLDGVTSTANISWQRTADTTGGYEILAGSGTITSHKPGEFGFQGFTTTQFTKIKYSAAGGPLDLLMGSSTLGTWTTDGMKHRTKAPMEFTTTGNPVGTALFTAHGLISAVRLATTGMVTITSCRFTSKGSGIVVHEMVNATFWAVGSSSGTLSFEIRLYRGFTTTALTLAATWPMRFDGGGGTVAAFVPDLGFSSVAPNYPILKYYDSSVSAGEIVYEWRANMDILIAGGTLSSYGSLFTYDM